ncbi:MAG: recombinase family protein [Candidatus Gracilibacteria bacterium]|nr:recombinase family protein [Candidatus Gracilibacteria bacterium]
MSNLKADYIDFEDDENEEGNDGEFDNVEVDEEELDDYIEAGENSKPLEYLGYTRQSKAGNSELTFDAQNKAIKKYARDNNLKLSDIFEEEKSGYVSGKRVQFETMISLMEKDSQSLQRKYGGVIFFDISRMARNGEDFIKVEKLYKLGYKFISIKENIVDSAAGMYFFRMICSESIFYSDRQSSKATQYGLFVINRNAYAYLGGSSIQYGYTIKKHGDKKSEIIVNPFHAKVIKRIFELNYEGYKHKNIIETIFKEFNSECDSLNRGKKRSYEHYYLPRDEKTISKILLNKERIRYNGKRFVIIDIKFEDDLKILHSFYKRPKDIKKGRNILIFETPKLRIIDDSLYDSVLLKNMDRQHRKIEVGVFDGALYSGVLKCVCGGDITGQRGGNGNKYRYMCQNARTNSLICDRKSVILEEQIDDLIYKEIIKYIYIGPLYEVIFDLVKKEELVRINDGIKSHKIRLAGKERKLDKIETELVNVNNIYDKMNANTEILLFNIIPGIKKEIKDIKDEIELLEAEGKKIEANLKIYIERTYEIIQRYKDIGKDIKKDVVDILLNEIVLDEEKSEENRYRHPKDRKTEGGYQKQLLKVKLLGEFQFVYNHNKSSLGKQQ